MTHGVILRGQCTKGPFDANVSGINANSIKESIDQSINEYTNQSINQSIN